MQGPPQVTTLPENPLDSLDDVITRSGSTSGNGLGASSLCAARALQRLFEDRSRSLLRVEEIDAEPAARSPLAEAFTRAGFRPSYKGLELERSGRTRD